MRRSTPEWMFEASSMGIGVVSALGKLETKLAQYLKALEAGVEEIEDNLNSPNNDAFTILTDYLSAVKDQIEIVGRLGASNFTAGSIEGTMAGLNAIDTTIDPYGWLAHLNDEWHDAYEEDEDRFAVADEGMYLLKTGVMKQRKEVETALKELSEMASRVKGRNDRRTQQVWDKMVATLGRITKDINSSIDELAHYSQLTSFIANKMGWDTFERAYTNLKKINAEFATTHDFAKAFGAKSTPTGELTGDIEHVMMRLKLPKYSRSAPTWHKWATFYGDFEDLIGL